MQIIYRSVEKVTLKDKDGKEFELPVESFCEYDDDIRITTPFRRSDVQRGWVGDLTYETTEGIELQNCEKVSSIKETLNNVLLKNILLTVSNHESPCDWEYIFLKK